jgi:HlyD family secretion protein
VQSVQIGSFVSGPIQEIYVDFNAKVKKGQLLAKIDPLLCKAQYDQANAMLVRADADLMQAKAKLEQAERDWKRVQKLLPAKAIADTDYDMAKATYEGAKANVAICKATIEQNKGALKLAKTNLDYTEIKSPVDGIVTDRKVDPGQTLASQFQTPVMFVVAPDLEKKVYVLASVDEADIGLIREAQKHGQPVSFTVDAYRKDVFQGKIAQIRLTPTTVQNVVTYTVVVEASNLELKLLPGMTASLKFQIETRVKALKVSNAALRFNPKPKEVRECDRKLVEDKTSDDKDQQNADSSRGGETDDDSPAESSRKERYVWIADGDLLSAVKIVTGLESSLFTEVVSGELSDGQAVVTGTKTH